MGDPVTNRRSRRVTAALAGSAALHIGFGLTVFFSLPTGAFRGGAGSAGGDGGAVEVSLVGPIGGSPEASQAAAAEAAARLQAMMRRARTDQFPTEAQSDPEPQQARPASHGDLGALFKEIAAAHGASGPKGAGADGSG